MRLQNAVAVHYLNSGLRPRIWIWIWIRIQTHIHIQDIGSEPGNKTNKTRQRVILKLFETRCRFKKLFVGGDIVLKTFVYIYVFLSCTIAPTKRSVATY